MEVASGLGWKLPPSNFGVYPERRLPQADAVERLWRVGQAWAVSAAGLQRTKRLSQIVPLVDALKDDAAGMDDESLRAETVSMRRVLRVTGCDDIGPVARCFALVREASDRVLGMRHHDVQVVGAYGLLRGMIAEMETGEGKTLTAALAAIAGSLAGWPVHVITVNDYLVERDADGLRPLYEFFGLSVGVVIGGQQPSERRAAYASDIAYCTNKEIAFDYLRDRIVLGQRGGNLRLQVETLTKRGHAVTDQLLLRGLHFAIVDEADSVMIDEARTPLIISGNEGDSSGDVHVYRQALEFSRRLQEGIDFHIRADERNVVLTEGGAVRIEEMAHCLGGSWASRVLREEIVVKALTARFLHRKGEHFIVRDGKVEIIDEYTGRVMPDRFWSEGIHQMVELEEGCEVTRARTTLARMTYQRFFRRYKRLSGMTGTASEVSRELWRVYRLAVAKIPVHRPRRLLLHRSLVVASGDAKWRVIVDVIQRLHHRGAPVLLGTRTVAASETAARYLSEAGVPFELLNAKEGAREAEIVAQAGQCGRVTISTNMSGRGTDIYVGDDAADLGGLHVVMSERHESGRIDRQLAGRAGRQGRPGSFQPILSLDDPLMDKMDRRGIVKAVATRLLPVAGQWVGRIALLCAQMRAERLHARMRNDLLSQDEHRGSTLAFSGKPE